MVLCRLNAIDMHLAHPAVSPCVSTSALQTQSCLTAGRSSSDGCGTNSVSSGVDLELAPPILVEAMTGERVEPASHDEAGSRGRGPQTGTFHIYATVEAGSGAVAAIEAVVTTSHSVDTPVIVREWREPPRQVVPPLVGAGT